MHHSYCQDTGQGEDSARGVENALSGIVVKEEGVLWSWLALVEYPL